MNSQVSKMPIGIFDSGVGGISVLGEAMKLLPRERFIYFADSSNAPYGIKDYADVEKYSIEAAQFLFKKGIKALVVACNTATAVAINHLRASLSIPVIGMEPAIKPAMELAKDGKILVMATPVTLRQEKFNQLLHRFDEHSKVMPLPCPGLVELIEQGKIDGKDVKLYFDNLFQEVPLDDIAVVVLGCTHYIFVNDVIKEYFSPQVPIINGNCGTAKHLKHVLEMNDLCLLQGDIKAQNNKSANSRVEFYTSGNPAEVIKLCKDLLNKVR